MSYDYMVLAGTQGHMNHLKKDRLFELAEHNRAAGGAVRRGRRRPPRRHRRHRRGRPRLLRLQLLRRLSGLVPLVGITNGYCFAGNAALLGCCDVIIATEGSNIGMGGPAMVEGGGLGVFPPEEIGPLDVQVANGVVDVAVADEAEAVQVAKQYLGYFQGPSPTGPAPTSASCAHLIPGEPAARLRRAPGHRAAGRRRLACWSCARLRRRHHHRAGPVEGRPIGIVANNPAHLGGAIDSVGADKAARFMQLCDAFDCRCCSSATRRASWSARKPSERPGAPLRAHVRGGRQRQRAVLHHRAAQGLRARRQAMAGGSFKVPMFTVSWPTGEFGGMGLEGAVKLGYRNELAAIDDPEERERAYQEMVQRMYDRGKGRQHGPGLRDRRRHRPGRLAALDHDGAGERAGPHGPGRARSARTSTPGTAVAGIRVRGDNVRASSVVLATGGFGANPQLLERLYPDAAGQGDWAWYIGSRHCQGDGLRLGEAVGADVVGHNRGLLLTTPNFRRVLEVFVPGWLVYVNREGRRFVDETAEYAVMSGVIQAQTGGSCFAVFDETARREAAPHPRYADAFAAGALPMNWVADELAAQVQTGRVIRADSLAALAERCGIRATALEATVERYNADVAAGQDRAFFKAGEEMKAIATPPFYAVEIRPAIICLTSAGLRIDPDCRVLDSGDRPVPGLFAAGETTGGVLGERYVGGGNSITNAIVFGRRAGRRAAAGRR
jgi:hypothetical protein